MGSRSPEANFSGFANLTTTLSGATPGCVSVLETPSPSVTIGNADAYVINIRFDAARKDLDFRGARISYKLQVSPAPVSAYFNDVGTGHPFFQFIEALNASGITSGCQVSPPLYCPDNPVTRGQMAVFLAKALGLHWLN